MYMNTIKSMTDYRYIRSTDFFEPAYLYNELSRKERRKLLDLCVGSVNGQKALLRKEIDDFAREIGSNFIMPCEKVTQVINSVFDLVGLGANDH